MRLAHGVDCFRPTADEADRAHKAKHEKNTIEVLAEREDSKAKPKPTPIR